jgi:hypothetical protein
MTEIMIFNHYDLEDLSLTTYSMLTIYVRRWEMGRWGVWEVWEVWEVDLIVSIISPNSELRFSH